MKIRLLIPIVIIVLLAGCSWNDERNEKRGRGDAPTASIDDSPKEVVQFPDRFSNVAHACDGYGHRIFVTTQTDSGRQMEVIDDPTCES